MSGSTGRRPMLRLLGASYLRLLALGVPGPVRARWAEEWRHELVRCLAEPPSRTRETLRHLAGALRDVRELRAIHRRERGGLLDRIGLEMCSALAGLRGAPSFTLTALVVFASGIAAGATLISVLDTVLWRPLPLAAPDRVVQIEEHRRVDSGRVGELTRFPRQLVDRWRSEAATLEGVAAVWDSGFENVFFLGGGARPERLRGALASSDFFAVLGAQPRLGRTFRPEDPPEALAQSAVVSEGFWRRQFAADPAAVGATIELNGAAFRLAGVMHASFGHTLASERPDGAVPEVWIPIEALDRLPRLGARESRMATADAVFARLAPGTGTVAAAAELQRSFESALESTTDASRVVLVPLRERLTRDARALLVPLSLAGGVILLLVSLNVAGLQVVRSRERSGELAIRAALGAGRGRLARQVVFEIGALAVAGGLLALPLTAAALEAVTRMAPATLPRTAELGLDLRTMALVAAVTLAAAVAAALAPASQMFGHRAGALSGSMSAAAGSVGGARLRPLLVVGQVALTTVLLASGGLVARSAVNLLAVDHGMEIERVVAIDVFRPYTADPAQPRERTYVRRLLETATTHPGVVGAALTSSAPFLPRDYYSSDSRMRRIGAGYFELLGIELLAGRSFGAGDPVDAVVIDAAYARDRFGAPADAVGRRLEWPGWEEKPLVVGVVESVRHVAIDQEPIPVRYEWLANHPDPHLTLLVRSAAEPSTLIPSLLRALQRIDPDQPLQNVRTLEESLASSEAMRSRAFYLQLLAGFAALATLIALVGIYVVVRHTAATRRFEFGVRVALGAEARQIAATVVGQALGLATLGGALGALGGVLAAGALETVLYGVPAADPATLGGVGLALAAIVAAASWGPARRALRDDPARVLRAR